MPPRLPRSTPTLQIHGRFSKFSSLSSIFSSPSIPAINPSDLNHHPPENEPLDSPQNITNPSNPPLSHFSDLQSAEPSCFPSPDREIRDLLAYQYAVSRCPEEAKQLHLKLVKHGLWGELFLSNTLINVLVRVGELGYAHKVFDEMPERNVVTWASLISGYVKGGLADCACTLFRGMVCAGFWPNCYVFGSVLRACQELGSQGVMFGMQVHGLVSKTWFAYDVAINNALISMYGS